MMMMMMMMMMKMKPYLLLKRWRMYNPGEIAGVQDDLVQSLMSDGVIGDRPYTLEDAEPDQEQADEAKKAEPAKKGPGK